MEGLASKALALVSCAAVPCFRATSGPRADSAIQLEAHLTSSWAFRLSQEAQVRRHPGAARARHARQRKSIRHPEACGAPPALRPAARARRRDEELGGHPRSEPCSGRETACGPVGGSSDRVQRIRRHHSAGGVWRRHRDDLGPRPLGADGDPHADSRKVTSIFTLEGEKLRGRWHLVRMHGRGGEKKEPWL